MKLLHDGKTVLAMVDGLDRMWFGDGIEQFDGDASAVSVEIDKRGLAVSLSCQAALAETDDERRVYELLGQRKAIDDVLATVKVPEAVAADVEAKVAVLPVIQRSDAAVAVGVTPVKVEG
jgi:hypothetical protein